MRKSMLPSKFVPCFGNECQSEYKSTKTCLVRETLWIIWTVSTTNGEPAFCFLQNCLPMTTFMFNAVSCSRPGYFMRSTRFQQWLFLKLNRKQRGTELIIPFQYKRYLIRRLPVCAIRGLRCNQKLSVMPI